MTELSENSSTVLKLKKTQEAVTGGGSPFTRYQDVVVGSRSFLYTLYFEFCIWLAHIPGAIGLILRKIFWPRLFGSCGKGVAFGENVILRHPKKIHLGNRVVISERCLLEARTSYSSDVIILHDDVILSNDVILSCKEGQIEIGERSGIGAQTIIHSRIKCNIHLGNDVLIGPRCYIAGGGSYNTERTDIPIAKQGKRMDGGVRFEDDVWLGANVTVLGGVVMGKSSIAAAGAVVTKSVPERAICMGVPAKVVKIRGE